MRERGREGNEGRVLRRSSSLRPMRRKPTESMQACTKMAMASCGVLSCGESAAAAAGRLASMLRSTVGALNGRAAMVGIAGGDGRGGWAGEMGAAGTGDSNRWR